LKGTGALTVEERHRRLLAPLLLPLGVTGVVFGVTLCSCGHLRTATKVVTFTGSVTRRSLPLCRVARHPATIGTEPQHL
jgi:hypothetical protein